jgi:pyruvate,water dikinase
MHFGTLVLPLTADVYQHQMASGFNRTAERYQLPVRAVFLYINGYVYNSYPQVDLPPEFVQRALAKIGRVAPALFNAIQGQIVQRMTAKYMAHVSPIMAALDAQWQQNWRPELQQHLAFMHDFDLAGASYQELLAHLDESLRRIERIWALHFEILVPASIAVSQFVDEYRERLDSKDGLGGDSFTVFTLLQGANHSFLQADQALWQLSRQARTLPIVRQTLEQNAAADVIPLLANHAEGQIFLAELRAWLDKYGQRGHGMDGLVGESWRDDPTPIIHNLQESVNLPDQDVVAEMQAQEANRQQCIAQARQRLQSQPATSSAAEPTHFDDQLKAAQSGEFLLTEHNFWIDQQAMYCLRQIFLEVGCRCVKATLIDAAQDVFYLTLEELFATVQSESALPRQTFIAERKRQLEHFRTLTPPDALGTMPWLIPPNEPFVRAMSRLFGGPLVPTNKPKQRSATILRGQAASAGKIRGRARVIHTLEEAERLQSGEILVTVATMPPWTPLLAIASGVVTNTGGILSHAAIIAREYGIPAVVATRTATEIIGDGQLLEVDGSAGVVYILPD